MNNIVVRTDEEVAGTSNFNESGKISHSEYIGVQTHETVTASSRKHTVSNGTTISSHTGGSATKSVFAVEKTSPSSTMSSNTGKDDEEFDENENDIETMESRSSATPLLPSPNGEDCSHTTASPSEPDSNTRSIDNNSDNVDQPHTQDDCDYSNSEEGDDDSHDEGDDGHVGDGNGIQFQFSKQQESGQPTEESSQRSLSLSDTEEENDDIYEFQIVDETTAVVDDPPIVTSKSDGAIDETEIPPGTNQPEGRRASNPELATFTYLNCSEESRISRQSSIVTTSTSRSREIDASQLVNPSFSEERIIPSQSYVSDDETEEQVVIIQDIEPEHQIESDTCCNNITIDETSSFSDVSYSQKSNSDGEVQNDEYNEVQDEYQATPEPLVDNYYRCTTNLQDTVIREEPNLSFASGSAYENEMKAAIFAATAPPSGSDNEESERSTSILNNEDYCTHDCDTQSSTAYFREALQPHLQYLADVQKRVQSPDYNIDETDLSSIYANILKTQRGSNRDLFNSQRSLFSSFSRASQRRYELDAEDDPKPTDGRAVVDNRETIIGNYRIEIGDDDGQIDESSSNFSYISESDTDDVIDELPLRPAIRSSRYRRASNETQTSHLSYSSHTSAASDGSISGMVSHVMKNVRSEFQLPDHDSSNPTKTVLPPGDDTSVSSATFLSAVQSLRDNNSSRHTRSYRSDDSQFYGSASNFFDAEQGKSFSKHNNRSSLNSISEIPWNPESAENVSQPASGMSPYRRNLQGVVDFLSNTLSSFRDLTKPINLNGSFISKASINSKDEENDVSKNDGGDSVGNDVDYGYSDEVNTIPEEQFAERDDECDDVDVDTEHVSVSGYGGSDGSAGSKASKASGNDSSSGSDDSSSQSTKSNSRRMIDCGVCRNRWIGLFLLIVTIGAGTGLLVYFLVFNTDATTSASTLEIQLTTQPSLEAGSSLAPSEIESLQLRNTLSPTKDLKPSIVLPAATLEPSASTTIRRVTLEPSQKTVLQEPTMEPEPQKGTKKPKSPAKCIDVAKNFIWDGVERNCSWLESSLRNSESIGIYLCEEVEPVYSVCRKTCGNCNSG